MDEEDNEAMRPCTPETPQYSSESSYNYSSKDNVVHPASSGNRIAPELPNHEESVAAPSWQRYFDDLFAGLKHKSNYSKRNSALFTNAIHIVRRIIFIYMAMSYHD